MAQGKSEAEVLRESEARRKIQKFLQARRNPHTKECVEKIIERLDKENDIDIKNKAGPTGGWVRVKTLLEEFVGESKLINNQTTLYRMLDDLFEERIIEKKVGKIEKERGCQATFYRTAFEYRQEWFITREMLESAYAEKMECIHDLIEQLVIAHQLLVEEGCPNPHDIIIERFIYQRKKKPSCSASWDPNLIREFTDQNGKINYQELMKKISTRG